MAKRIRDLAAALRELEAAGCPTLLGEALELGPQLRTSVVGGVADSMLYDLGLRMACIIDLELVNEFSSPLYVHNIELRFPWGSDSHFRWLEEGDLIGGLYHIPGTALQYAPEETLNSWLAGTARISGRHPKAGLLLGVGGAIPTKYEHGLLVDVELIITDHLGSDWPSPVQLSVDRTERISRRKRGHKPPHAGLYEPDTTESSGHERSKPATTYFEVNHGREKRPAVPETGANHMRRGH